MEYPEYGRHPIKCSRKKCNWVGYERELNKREVRKNIHQSVCPGCNKDAEYYFLTWKEMKKYNIFIKEGD